MLKEEKRDKKIKIFAASAFLNDLGADMISPIWPLFVTTVLKAPMSVLGFLDGLGESLVAFSQVISGFLSDKLRRRKIFIWLGYLGPVIGRIGYSISTTWQHLVPFRIFDRIGKMRDAPRDAMVAEAVKRERRGVSFGILEAMDSLGAVTGVVVSVLFFKFLGFRKLLFLAAIPSLISVFLIFFFIKESNDSKIYPGFRIGKLSKNLKLFFASSSIFSLGAFSYSFLLIFASNFGFAITFVPILYLIFTLVNSLFAWPFGRLADKYGRKTVSILSFLFWGLVSLGFLLSQNYWFIIFYFVLYGLHRAAWKPIQKTFVSELAPWGWRASTLGAFQMMLGLTALPASFIAGLLWDVFGPFAPFYFSLSLTVVAIILLILVQENNKEQT